MGFRVLQVCNTDFYLEKFLLPMIIALRENGIEVECMTEVKTLPAVFARHDIKVHSLEFPARASPIAFLTAIWRMYRFLRTNKFHLVNSHNRNSSIVARIACALAGVPVNLYTAHGFYFQDHLSPVAYRLAILFEGLLGRITTHILSQSNEDRQYMTSTGRLSEDRITFIGNGVDTKRFSPVATPQPFRTSTRFRIGAMGRLVSGKGFEDILRAMVCSAHTQDLELLFIGGNIAQDISPSASVFDQLTSELGLAENVRVTGMIDNVEDHLKTCDLFIHPSYAEGMPRSLLEAMSTGLPCIATRIRGAREIILPEHNGLLYEPHDCDELAAHIDRLFNAAQTRKNLGEHARQTVLERFREEDYIARQVEVIRSLLNKHVLDE
jgi:glycosyltransferase involved in cell wall biosynthesis